MWQGLENIFNVILSMLGLQLVKETFSGSFRGQKLRNVIGIIGITISDQLQNVSPFPQVGILLAKVYLG